MKKIRWADAEIVAVVTALPRVASPRPTTKQIATAQKVLPIERRRAVIGQSLINLLDRVRAQALKEGTLAPVEGKEPAPEKRPYRKRDREESALPEEADIIQPLRDVPNYLLHVELARRFEARQEQFYNDVLQKLSVVIALVTQHFPASATAAAPAPAEGAAPAVEQAPPAPAKPPKPRKFRVVLLGPLEDQFARYQRKFPALELRFLDKSKSPDSGLIPPSADAFLTDTHFVNHAWTHTAKNFCERKGIRYREGYGRAGIERELAYFCTQQPNPSHS